MSVTYPNPNCSVCEKKESCIIHKEAGHVMDYCSDYSGPFPNRGHNPRFKNERWR